MARIGALLTSIALCCTLNDDHEGVPRLYLGRIDSVAEVDRVELIWWLPAGGAAGFVLEQRVGSEPFRDIQQLAGDVERTIVELAPSIAGDVEFRLRVVPTGTQSGGVLVHRQLRTPTLAVTKVGAAFKVRFNRPAGSGDRIELSRRIVSLRGDAGTWTTLATVFDRENVYTDVDLSGWTDGARYDYRAIIYAGSQLSDPATVQTETASYLAAVVRSAEQFGDSVRLVFEWRSGAAETAEISYREHYSTTSTVVARTNAPGIGAVVTYDDAIRYPASAIGGIFEYTVAASGSRTTSGIARQWAVVRPANMTAALVDVPPGLEIARTSSGTFAVLADLPSSGGGASMRALIPPGGTASDAFALPSWYHPRMLVLDASGHPHAAFADSADGSGGSPVAVIHAWHDGHSWSTEEVGRFDVNGTTELARGADGTLHLAWRSLANGITVAHQQSGSWTVSALPDAFSSASSVLLAGDETGAPHLIADGESQPVHLWRDGFGWHSEQTPPLAFSWPGATARQPLFLFASAGRVTFLERGFLVGLQKFLSIATRSASGWESKGAGEFFSEQQVTDLYRAAISPDGSRIAIGTIDGILYLFDGINLSQLLWQNSSLTPFAVGFAPDGKAWALDYVSDATLDGAIRPPPRNAVLYGEF